MSAGRSWRVYPDASCLAVRPKYEWAGLDDPQIAHAPHIDSDLVFWPGQGDC